ncbi:hypothetical protein Hanom_Chr05g00407381 [Helianthus anomalus]
MVEQTSNHDPSPSTTISLRSQLGNNFLTYDIITCWLFIEFRFAWQAHLRAHRRRDMI